MSEILIKLKDEMRDRVKIPFHYIIFLIVLFVESDSYILFTIKNIDFISEETENLIVYIVNYIFYFVPILTIVIITMCVVIYVISSFTSMFANLLPKDVDYVDGTTKMWSQYIAINNMIKIIEFLSTTMFIYFLSINIFFVDKTKIYFNDIKDGDVRELFLKYDFMDKFYFFKFNYYDLLEFFITLFFMINIIILFFHIINALFSRRSKKNRNFINERELDQYHIITNFKRKFGKNSIDIMIVMRELMSNKEYFLIMDKYRTDNDEYGSYEIINTSFDIMEIKCHYELLEKYYE